FALERPLPVAEKTAIPPRWLRSSVFNHKAHTSVLHACTDCHGSVDKSEQTADVLLPHAEKCQECHAASGGVRFACVTCHLYHKSDETKQSVSSFIEKQSKGAGRTVRGREVPTTTAQSGVR